MNSIILTTTIILNKDKKILLIKRANKPFKDQWGLPGGKLDRNESLVESVRREIQEELGFLPLEIKLLKSFKFTEPDCAIVHMYYTQYNGIIIPNKKEIADYKWSDLENVGSFEPFPPNHRTVINYFIKKNAMNVDYITAKVSVNCIIVKNNKLLLVQQNRPEKAKGKWSIPGGKVNKGETFKEAIIRETKEETGLDVIRLKHLNIKQEKSYQTIKHIFKVETKGVVNFPKDELMDAKWFNLDEIKK